MKENRKKASSSLRSEDARAKIRPIYSDEFQILWDMVPKDDNPGSKSDAAKAFNRLTHADRDACIDGWMAYLDWLETKRAKRAEYPILHCVTFINQRRWESLEEANHG